MRRKEKEIKSKEGVESVIQKALVCRLGMADENGPYIVPLSFGYRDGFLFFHSAKEGKKIDILRKNKKVCFEIDTDHEIVESEKACKWGMEYKSVIGFGNAFIIEDIESIKAALDVIMDHYSGRTFEYQDEVLRKTVVIKVEIESMTGKKSEW